MLERIKTFGEAAKSMILWVLAPLAFIAGFLYFLISGKNREMADLKVKLSEDEVANTLDKIADAEEASDASDKDYKSVRDAYVRERAGRDDL